MFTRNWKEVNELVDYASFGEFKGPQFIEEAQVLNNNNCFSYSLSVTCSFGIKEVLKNNLIYINFCSELLIL